ncbi:hypothetical protein ACS0TY_021767 [Phlomoides rotata]
MKDVHIHWKSSLFFTFSPLLYAQSLGLSVKFGSFWQSCVRGEVSFESLIDCARFDYSPWCKSGVV